MSISFIAALVGTVAAAVGTGLLVRACLRMPRMDGIEACKQIRQLPRYAKVPILILTVFDSDIVKRRALRAGATAFLVGSVAAVWVGRMAGAAILGFAIGLMVALVEVAFRRAWLEVQFSGGETISA